MINNDFIFELDIDLDITALRKIAVNSYSDNKLLQHQRVIDNYEYLCELQKRYPILGRHWNVYKFLPQQRLPIHIDANRKATLNIPIVGGTDSITLFYKSLPEYTLIHDKQRALFTISDQLEEEFKFTLTKPAIIRTDVPHAVIAGNVPRIIISWGLSVTFSEAKAYFAP